MSDAARPRRAWTQVALAAALMLATLPGRTQGLGLITEPLIEDLRLDRVSYAAMNLWATLLGALLCLPAGWAIDRLGLRGVTLAVVLGLSAAVWQFSALAGSVTAVFVALLATRALGQCALSVCSIATVARWFPQRAGFAMGVYSVLLSVLFAGAFGVIGYSVRINGWREAWQQIALALACFFAPLVVLGLREPKPGNTVPHGAKDEPPAANRSFTLAEALQTRAFWVFAGAAAAFNLVSSGLGLFNEAVLAERGYDQKDFHIFLAVTTLFSLGGQFLCGWLLQFWKHHSLAALSLAVYSLGLAGIPMAAQHWQLWCLALLLGGAGGMVIVIFFSVWSDFFGQKHLGRIQGAAQMLTVLSSGLGPLLFASCAKLSGSHGPLLFALAGLSLVLAGVAMRIRPPEEPGL